MNYDIVLLDADGTLLDFEAASAAAFATLFRGRAPELGEGALTELYDSYHAINRAIWLELERGEIDKEVLKTERFRRLLRDLAGGSSADRPGMAGLSRLDPESLGREYLDRLSREALLLPGALDFVRSLNARGCRPLIATNGVASVQRGRFAASPLGPLVGELLISEELGAEKPAGAFFEAAFARAGLRPGELRTVMVGDSWSADVEGALAYGLEAVWYNPEGRVPPREGSGALVVRDYAELLGVLGAG